VSDEGLRRRLQRLDRKTKQRGASRQPSPERTPGALPPGEEIQTERGTALRLEAKYPPEHTHGSKPLGSLLGFNTSLIAEVARQSAFSDARLEKLVFLDTETTGLVGGAGTIVFLVGVGTFFEGHFRLRQYFLRDPGEEAAFLLALGEDLDQGEGLVSFNGRAFDVPLLEMRYMLGLRRHWPLNTWPQLDLLHVARRLWRRSLPDCTLGTIEREVLAVSRSEQDVPGAEIPGMYLDYLRTGDASDMTRVIYHNAVDVLSLVVMASAVLELHGEVDPTSLSGEEALAVARWHAGAGRADPASNAYHAAMRSKRTEIRLDALRHFSAELKRAQRREEALPLWEEWHTLAPDDPKPCVELAMFYEWHEVDLDLARTWTEKALLSLTHWPPGWQREREWAELEHRMQRLARKLSAGS
jgi:uncharacterized protein YprB with RNaseH-like and TPR domain